jgi:hypothetical protein
MGCKEMKQRIYINKTIVHYLIYIVLLSIVGITLLSFSACECIGLYGGSSTSAKTVEQDVNSSMIDTNDATEINIAIATERVFGDISAEAGLIAYKEYKSLEYLKEGRDAGIDGDHWKAIENYEKALEWTEDDKGKYDMCKILSSAYEREAKSAETAGHFTTENQDSHRRKAAGYEVEAAKHAGSEQIAAYSYLAAGRFYWDSGSKKDGCANVRKAWVLATDPYFKVECDKLLKMKCGEKGQ